jgi:hypothetical protein
MRITVYDYSIEVDSIDTIWTLKKKIHHEFLKGSYGSLLPPPDDQRLLLLLPSETELNDCGKTLSFYGIHEGTDVMCEWKKRPGEKHFRSLLDVCRKDERTCLKLWEITQRMTVFTKHVCCHGHEVRALSLWSNSTCIVLTFSHHVLSFSC